MRIFSITEEQIDLFTGLAGQRTPEQIAHTAAILADLWASSQSRPEWCFLAQAEGELIGRVGYRRQGSGSEAIDDLWLVELVLPWEANYLAAGQTLLKSSIQEMHGYGAKSIHQQVHSDWDIAHQMRELFEGSGFALRQAKSAFVMDLPHEPVVVGERLLYRNLEEVGEAAFIEAIQRSSDRTLDEDDLLGIEEVGLHQLAQNYFELLQDEHWAYEPSWWQLAYDQEGHLVGFVQPLIFRKTPAEGTIGYIGVVPEKRGQHYVDDLLAKAHHILQEANATEMFCDTDSKNLPMIQSFERAGYKEAGTNWHYQMDLEG